MAPSVKPWIPATHDDYDRLVGKEVFTRGGEKLGKIKEVYHPDRDLPLVGGDHAFLIDTGKYKDWFGDLDEVYIPETAISGVGDDGVVLFFSEDEVKDRDWSDDASLAAGLATVRRY
ncbi:MAG: hypothetical protein QOF01_2866 [Thermomicrobiales bacterium]|jgi:sporulation protein YlmC with PRC-barrel domain|nr:hypothetical protein [Thermomicrobiales bacterium]MEA2525484.1 hypothetical protein [Thermomicrobiales bacterium]MEA2596397.1 hypothetical protein [Thermomicrobiales bacterium]